MYCLLSHFYFLCLLGLFPLHFFVQQLVALRYFLYYVVCRFSSVTAAMVKQLRELTGAPMMDCKKALQAEGVDGDLDKAVEVLRKQGMKRVNKVSSRTTQQGIIASAVEEKKAALVEVWFSVSFLWIAVV